MSKQNELVKNTAIITFGKICTQLVTFLLLPLYTKILTTEEYGTVDLVITYSSLLVPFITLALEQGLFRFLIDVRNDKKRVSEYISTTFFVTGIISICIIVILGVVKLITNNILFFYFSLVLLGSIISAISLQLLRGLGDNIGYAFASSLSGIIQVILNVIFLIGLNLKAPGMMLATFLGNLSCGIFLMLRCSLFKVVRFKYVKKHIFLEMFKYSFPLIPNQISWWALNASDKVIVQAFIGVSGNGLIAVANKFSGVFINFANVFNVSWTESAVLHIHDDDAQEFFNKTINSVFKLFLSACCLIIVFIPFIFPVMINSQYNETYGLIPIFMLSSLCNIIVGLYGVIYVAFKKTKEISKTAIYAAILNIISHLILVKLIGIYAAPISTLIGYGVMAIYRYFDCRKYITVKFTNETMLFTTISVLVSCASYYSINLLVNIISLIFIFLLSIVINKSMIIETYKMFKNKLLSTNS